MKRLALPGWIAFFALLAAGARAEPRLPRREEAIPKGVDYLLISQNRDGSWGSLRGAEPFVWGSAHGNTPETQRGWRIAVTGLSFLALHRHGGAGADEALSRALGFLLEESVRIKRPGSWDSQQVWGWIYAIEALSAAERSARFAGRAGEIRPVVDRLIRSLAKGRNPDGGWNYFDIEYWGGYSYSVSFTTASAMLALLAARDAGHPLPPRILADAARALRRARLPSRAYMYNVIAVPAPRGATSINWPQGALGRMQVCNLALLLSKEGVTKEDLRKDLDLLFRHHRFLDIACYRHVPHEVWYRNSGYFYLYAHWHAARSADALGGEDGAAYRRRLEPEILKHQQADGSFWDWPFHGYAKPYGTAIALLALAK